MDDDSQSELVRKDRNGFKCMFCGYSSRTWVKVNIHAKEQHLKCSSCDNMQFESTISLKAHYQTKDHGKNVKNKWKSSDLGKVWSAI